MYRKILNLEILDDYIFSHICWCKFCTFLSYLKELPCDTFNLFAECLIVVYHSHHLLIQSLRNAGSVLLTLSILLPRLPHHSSSRPHRKKIQKLMMILNTISQEVSHRLFNPFKFTIVIFIHYKPRIAATILDL